ncbi:MAG: DNA primase [Nitrospiraceae bacterium]
MGRGLISKDVIDRIRDRVDIVEIVSQHVALAKAGQGFKARCPFHQDKTPSFTVSPSKQIFHCFGCGVGGDVFAFLERTTGDSFPEVVQELGRKVGIEVVAASGNSEQQASPARRLEEINRAAAVWFQHNLRDAHLGANAREYLAGRGIRQTMTDQFGIGVAPLGGDGLLKALTRQGFTPGELLGAGLLTAREKGTGYYDKFRARIMFTITDLRKRVVGFGGRVLGEGLPKYLNSPDTPLFKKGQTLFAFDHAREAIGRTKTVIVVEGYFDAIALHQAGITHTVATLGTALTPEHVQVLRRFAANVVLLFDPDAAGVRAALRGLELFVNSGLGVKVITLPAGEDPDTFVRKEGAGAFAGLEAAAPSLLDYALDYSMKQAESGALETRIRSVDDVLRILQRSEHPIEREERLRLVAERLGINQSRLIERYPALVNQPKPEAVAPRAHVAPGAAAPLKGVPEERDLLLLLLHGKLSPADVRRLRPEAFTVATCRKLVGLALTHLERDGRIGVRSLLDAAVDDPDCGALATELSLRDDHFDDVPAHIKACLERLDRKRAEQELRDLTAQLKTAEREGRVDDARALNMRVNELRMRKAGSPTTGVVSS